jgi:thymidylate synthase
MDIAPHFIVEDLDFHDSWIAALYNIINHGVDIVFGSEKEPKKARDTSQVIIFEGKALEQIENEDIHPAYGLKKGAMQGYVDEFDRDWYKEYKKLPLDSPKRFTYLYIERLIDTYTDQLDFLRRKLKKSIDSGIASNRDLAITWNPIIDADNDSPPCFQQVWIRYCGSGIVDMRFLWRSRDCFDALPGNEVGAVKMVNKEVLIPNNCRIGRLIDISYSLHVYHGRLQEADKILREEENRNPGLMRKLKY